VAEITLKSRDGRDAGTVELADAVFGIQPNVPVMHQVVTAQLAHRRAGTHSTKTRSEVRGGGAKPYRQKGTGNARQGSTTAPHYSGGGIALGPRPRSYSQRTPKKMIRLALRSALSDRAREGKVLVVDDWGFEQPKTKDAKAALAALGIERRALVVVDRDDAAAALSFRNLAEVQLIEPPELNAYDVLCNEWIVFTRATLAALDAPAEKAEPADSADAAEPVVASETHTDEPAEGERSDDQPSEPAAHAEEPAEGEPVAEDEDVAVSPGEAVAEGDAPSTEDEK
jgi:large subunit ribosomal protein L4